jgi:hypothetical protein
MSLYNPPNELLPIFNPENYFWEDLTPLTQGAADLRYLKKTGDVATGTISFLTGVAVNDGSVATPAMSFLLNSNTGIYRSGTNQLSISAGGVEVFRTTPTSCSSLARFFIADGTAAAPSLAFGTQTNTGIYRPTTNQLGFSVNGTLRAYLDLSSVVSTSRFLTTLLGSATAPVFSFTGATNTGMYRVGGPELRFTVNGSDKLTIGPTTNISLQNLNMNNNALTNAPQVGNSAGNLEVQMNSTGAGGTLTLTGGTGLLASTAGGSSGEHLVLTINGVQYKIKLENP